MIFKKDFVNRKFILAVVSIVVGVVLIVFAAHGMHEASEAKESINHFTDFFTNNTGFWNPVIKFFGGEAHERASKYDTLLLVLMIAGVAMLVSGAWGVYKRKR